MLLGNEPICGMTSDPVPDCKRVGFAILVSSWPTRNETLVVFGVSEEKVASGVEEDTGKCLEHVIPVSCSAIQSVSDGQPIFGR
jgi:hypothetical protein